MGTRWFGASTFVAAAALVASGCSSPATVTPTVASEVLQPIATARTSLTQSLPTPPTTALPLPLPTNTTRTTSTTTTTRPIAPLPLLADLEAIQFQAEPIAEFDFPTSAAVGPDGALYIAGQLGPVWRFVDGSVADTLVVDLTDRTSVIEAASSERGVLGLAFGPVDERLYVHFTDASGGNVVSSWALERGVADPDSERLVLTQNQPGPGHNGGGLAFAPTGELFVGIGDGGASNGDDARDASNFLGSILRVLPRADSPGYVVPDDNPFTGDDGVAPETWAFGFRNPWRLYFDAPTANLWVGDVGTDIFEELNVVAPGAASRDFGWNIFEGTRRLRNRDIGETILPRYEWGRELGVGSIGAVVYRDDAIAGLDGAVVFGDLSGTLMLLGSDGVSVQRPGVAGLVSLHVGSQGELYGLVIWGQLVQFTLLP